PRMASDMVDKITSILPREQRDAAGVENPVIVDTEDALLIAHRDHSQDVGRIVRELGQTGWAELI
ncbi:MAG TPA: hypothetical protein VF742_15380, partial [Terracidiphilus sp.]